ncbi:MAG: RCC1 repeat-containing protein, partial [Coriobacteriia bacterium]|nr:RCC1 repeat-containing protein [Coriobacteriia bacterium]
MMTHALWHISRGVKGTRNRRGGVRVRLDLGGLSRFLFSPLLVVMLLVPGIAPATASDAPATTRPAPSAQRLATGDGHTLQIRSDGTLWSWGYNNHGQLGLGDTTNRILPSQIGADTDWVSVAAGGSGQSLALKSDGTLWAWGWNGTGQLGLGDLDDRYVPVQLGSRTDWVSIDTGMYHSLAIRSDGTLWAWGYNLKGELGDGSTTMRTSPVQVSGTDWVSVKPGFFYTLGLKSDGTLWSWGYNNHGQLGLGDTVDRHTPTQVGGTGWTSTAAGQSHSLAVQGDGTLWSWGDNANGQLGLNDTSPRSAPAQVAGTGWVSVAAGSSHTLATRSDGTLWGWGLNYAGNLGLGDLGDRWSPTQVGLSVDWITVDAGANHSAALKGDGALWVWGYNFNDWLGLGNVEDRVQIPKQITPAADWTQVDGGAFHAVAIRSDGTLWSWGLGGGDGSPLGHGDQTMRLNPTRVGSDSSWVSVSAGEYFSSAVKADGTLWAWGTNYYGQFGNGDSGWLAQSTVPVRAGTDNDWVAVSAGKWHTLALKANGTLWSTGRNTSAQLGLGDSGQRAVFTQVGTDTDWAQLSAGNVHSMAR